MAVDQYQIISSESSEKMKYRYGYGAAQGGTTLEPVRPPLLSSLLA
jgi:hypothetical protein